VRAADYVSGNSAHATHSGQEFADPRRHPRFKLETKIRIYSRNRPVVRGYTIDISESGISAMLPEEIPLNELVRLEFTLRTGDVDLYAMVQQRNAFRYGFKFVEPCSSGDAVGLACRQLAVEQAVQGHE
jgi:hypothetical protein